MIGLVLCGGQSTRMGTDKGLMISTKKVTWAQQSFSLLAKLDLPVVISVNPTQITHYRRIFPMAELILDREDTDIKGPLLGLLSVHKKYANEDIFVLACDMVEMNLSVMNYLFNYYNKQEKKEAFVFTHDNMAEPFCAIYSAEGLEKIEQLYKQGLLEKHSLKYSLEQLDTVYLPLKQEWTPYFRNANSPKDLKSICKNSAF